MNRSYVLIASSHLSHQKSASTLLRAGHATQRLSLPAPSSSPRSAAAMAPAKSPRAVRVRAADEQTSICSSREGSDRTSASLRSSISSASA